MTATTALVLLAAFIAVALSVKPHIVMFLVDDLGWSNVGFHNAEPLTPTIDELAKSGLILNRHYAYKFCSPTRSAFLSGRLPIHVNQENHPPDYPGGGIPLGMTTLAEKLYSAGYVSHQVGKWHCGMSTTNRLPVHRGFTSSLGYLSGAEDHFSQERGSVCGKAVDFWDTNTPAYGQNGTYGTYQYANRAQKIIRELDEKDRLFLYLAFQNVHAPVEAPEKFLAMYPNVDYKPRKGCLGMISVVDEAIKNVTALLKEKNMWEETLVIFSSDNGGPHDHANNYPLRGSKGSDFEGGVRVAAFINGGFMPTNLKGKESDGLMHIADWYATLTNLVNASLVDDKAVSKGLPPVDSLDMWPMLTGKNLTSPRVELPLSGGPGKTGSGYINWPWKLVRGEQSTSFFPGPKMPNSTDDGRNSKINCGTGCLFNLEQDATEHVDLAKTNPDKLKELVSRAEYWDTTFFQSEGEDKADCKAYDTVLSDGGYWGPWQD